MGVASPDDESTQRRLTLGQLLEVLGPSVVTLLAAPRGLDVEIGSPVIHDSSHPPHFEIGDAVLAVGADGHRAEEVLVAAGERGAAAVLFLRSVGLPPTAVERAERLAVAVILIEPEMSWGHLYTLIRTARAGASRVPAEAARVPMGDLFALANAVASMVGGPVTIEDVRFHVVAYSNVEGPVDELRMQTILGRRSPAAWMQRFRDQGFLRRVMSTDEVVHVAGIPEEGVLPRIAVRVRAGGDVLGSIWAIVGPDPVTPSVETALGEAGRIAALHMLRHVAAEELERRQRGDLLLALLEGRGVVETTAAQLGVDTQETFTVVAFEILAVQEPELALQCQRTLDLVAVYCEAFRRLAACVSKGRTVYALLPSVDETDASRARAVAAEIVERAATSLRVALVAGIGSTAGSLRSAHRSRVEADQVTRVLTRSSRHGPVRHIDDVRAQTLILELQDLAADRPHLRRGRLDALRTLDDAKATSYFETLRAYLDHRGDVTTAAAKLSVHPNTLRYRLRRIVEISGLDLDDPDERLVTDLQLRFG